MKIVVITFDEQFITVDVDSEQSVENLKALLKVETRVPLQQQQLIFNGNELNSSSKLSSFNVRDGELLVMKVATAAPFRVADNDLNLNPDGSCVNPGAFQQHVRRDSNMMTQLLQALLNADPFDVEAQKRIEAAIRQKGTDENWEAALEHNPEAFARVVMLYVNMEVNGMPLKAFVDSGAQSTMISKSCEGPLFGNRIKLLRLLDQRYKGIAHGVGQAEILGRIHVAPIKIGDVFYPCSFMVLDAPNMEFLFGLDMLRKHQCMIDLKDNVLRVGGGEVSVPFLLEKHIPAQFLDRQASDSDIVPSGAKEVKDNIPTRGQSSGTSQGDVTQTPGFEAKLAKVVELGFSRDAVVQALRLSEGNEEQAAGYLFWG
ncbi:hypothetical protein MKX01_039781 [Papaver californicum]|nr:hypothetical protein MKX01_039781 [Papaver californicum]